MDAPPCDNLISDAIMEDNYNENGSCGCCASIQPRDNFVFSQVLCEYSQQTVGIPINIACLIQILISNMLNSDRQLIERRRDIFFTFWKYWPILVLQRWLETGIIVRNLLVLSCTAKSILVSKPKVPMSLNKRMLQNHILSNCSVLSVESCFYADERSCFVVEIFLILYHKSKWQNCL